MKILILAAMDKELDLLLNLLRDIKTAQREGISIHEGKIGENIVAVAKCGIGKVNAAINTQLLLNFLKPDLVINSGVAGGAGIPIASVLIADRVAYHDVWCGPGTNYGQADGIPLFLIPSAEILTLANEIDSELSFGLICSGDKFISTPEEIRDIRSHFPEVCAVDMESASIAQVCFMTSTPFAVIRVVSDTPGEGENITQYQNFWKEAPEKTFHVLSTLLKKI